MHSSPIMVYYSWSTLLEFTVLILTTNAYYIDMKTNLIKILTYITLSPHIFKKY